MNRVKELDPRPIRLNGKAIEQVDVTTLTAADRDYLLLAIAEAVNAINQRTFRGFDDDTSKTTYKTNGDS